MKTLLALMLVVYILAVVGLCNSVANGQCGPSGCGPGSGTFQVWEKPRATQPPAQQMHPAIVRVNYETPQGTDGGTGTIIQVKGDAAYVLTCWHIFLDNWPRGRAVVICKGKRYTAKILKHDKLWDVALLGIENPGVSPAKFAETMPKRGESLWTFALRTGTVHRKLETWYAPSKTAPGDMLGLTSARCSLPGDSGGAIINTRGRLVGVISGGRNERGLSCVGTCFLRIRRILRGVLPPYPNRPGWVIPKRPRRVVPIAPPPRIAPVAPEPQTMPNPQPQPPALLVALEARIAILEQKLLQPGPPGPPGPRGPAGHDGSTGLPGAAGRDTTPAFYTITPRKPKGI